VKTRNRCWSFSARARAGGSCACSPWPAAAAPGINWARRVARRWTSRNDTPTARPPRRRSWRWRTSSTGAPPSDAACYAVNSAFDKGYQHQWMAVKFPYNPFAANSCAIEARGDFGVSSLSQEEIDAEARQQCRILRDIFGNPFRSVVLDPAWVSPLIRAMARAIYDDRSFGDMPILADALEDAGCPDEQILEHCRKEGLHVRGCWCVDLLLEKS
jgi:hypothetical protein